MEGKSSDENNSGKKEEQKRNGQNGEENCSKRDQKTTFNEALTVLLVVASLLGINIVRRSKSGELRLSSRNMLMSGISLCMVVLSLTMCLGVFCSIDSSYEQKIILLPLLSSCCFCLYAYVLWLVKSRRLLAYIKEVDDCDIKLRQGRLMPIAVVFYFCYSVFYTLVVYFMIPLPEHIFNFPSENLKWVFIISVFFTCLVPAILDLYTFSFIFVLVVAVRSLKSDARAIQTWTKENTNALAKTWLKYRKILGIYNGVFSYLLHVRMLMFMVHAITHLFSLVSLDWKIECAIYFWALCGSMGEVMLRFLIVCNSGQKLIDVHESVIKVVREAQFNSCVAADSDPNEILEDADTASWVLDETDVGPKRMSTGSISMKSTTEESSNETEITSVKISVNPEDTEPVTVTVEQTTDISSSTAEVTDDNYNAPEITESHSGPAEVIGESIGANKVFGNNLGPVAETNKEAIDVTQMSTRVNEANEISSGTSGVTQINSEVKVDTTIVEGRTELAEENSGSTENTMTVERANEDPQMTEGAEDSSAERTEPMSVIQMIMRVPTVIETDMKTSDDDEVNLRRRREGEDGKGRENKNVRESESKDLPQELERQLTTRKKISTTEKTASAGQVMDSIDKICLQNFLRHLEEVPFHARVWGGSPLSAAAYINCMGVVFTYLVVLLQLRPGRNLNDYDGDDEGVLRCFMRW